MGETEYGNLPLADEMEQLSVDIADLKTTIQDFQNIAYAYDQSDAALIIDPTVYTSTTDVWTLKISFDIPILINANSVFRIKFEEKNSYNWKATRVKVDYVKGSTTNLIDFTFTGNTHHNIWILRTYDDITAPWAKGGVIKVYLRKGGTSGGTASLQNFEICGTQTPFIFS